MLSYDLMIYFLNTQTGYNGSMWWNEVEVATVSDEVTSLIS